MDIAAAAGILAVIANVIIALWLVRSQRNFIDAQKEQAKGDASKVNAEGAVLLIEPLNRRVDEQDNSILRLGDELMNVQQKLRRSEALTRDLEHKVSNLESENTSLGTDLLEMRRGYDQQGREIRSLTRGVGVLENDNRRLRTELKRSEAEVERIKSDSKNTQSRNGV